MTVPHDAVTIRRSRRALTVVRPSSFAVS